MRVDEAKVALTTQRPVRARYGVGSGFHGEGRVVGIYEQPTVVIETPSGRQFPWPVDLTDVLDADTDDDPDEDEEGPTYHGIVRYTHVHCGYTTRKRSEMEILNDGDPACPKCSDNSSPRGIPDYAYGAIVWEMADGTLVETYSNGQELTRWQPVRTHVDIYKSWVNGPEWWIVPRPNTGDIDGSDNLIVGFDTYQQALDAVTSGEMPALFNELCTDADGIAWRDRNDPTYQITAARCHACGNRLDAPLAVDDCPRNFQNHNPKEK